MKKIYITDMKYIKLFTTLKKYIEIIERHRDFNLTKIHTVL